MLSISQLTIDEQRRVEALCTRFENDWRGGRQPALQALLAEQPQGVFRDVLCAELVKLEFELRRPHEPALKEADIWERLSPKLTGPHRSAPEKIDEKVVLSIVAGPHQGESYPFTQHGTLMVGRARDAHWVLHRDPYFSRYHFRVECKPPFARLLDLKSSNGTFVNGRRETAVNLSHGDIISGGDTRIEVKIESAAGKSSGDSLGDRGNMETIELPARAAPKEIAGYRLERQLGQGAMGQVFLAKRSSTGQEVAVKLIRPNQLTTSAAQQLFLREANLLSQLRHRRIVECLEVGLHEHQMYLVMEYIPALDFEATLREASFPTRIVNAAAIICRVLEGLHFAHQQNIVHRDVKPSNILMFRRENRLSAKLADFGLAKNFQDAGLTGISEDHEVKGTLAYIAPEQLIECRYARPPCDIYAAGVCLYQFVSGQLPFDLQDGVAGIAMILNSPPIPLRTRCPQVPPGICELVDRALRHDPAERFATADEFRMALMKYARQ